MNILTVSQINFYLKSIVEENTQFSDLFVTGEISNFKNHYKSGHLYFSLKDEKSIIRCVMFSDYASRIKFAPQDGLKVLLRAHLGVYEAMGQYQLYVYDIQPYGLGAMILAFEQLKEKLDKLGLFDEGHKKPVPLYPQKIGIITADGSAALRDIENILKRRFPIAHLTLYPVLVQGKNSANELKNAVEYFNKLKNTDLIIIARGGGSQEDLSAFNDEKLAFAIYNSDIPIISGVGHQTDFTICDFAADLRAPTPSAAAELAVPDKNELLLQLDNIKNKLNLSVNSSINQKYLLTDSLKKELDYYLPVNKIKIQKNKLLHIHKILFMSEKNLLLNKRNQLNSAFSRLKGLSPFAFLAKGYALIFDSRNKAIKSLKAVNEGQVLKIRMKDGYINCIVKSKEENKIEQDNKLRTENERTE